MSDEMLLKGRGRDDAIIRGWILRHLDHLYPDSVEETVLESAVRATCAFMLPGSFSGYLTYLEEKGYLAWHTDVVLGEDMRIVRLTADGKDLLAERAIREPHINVLAPAVRPPSPLPVKGGKGRG